MSTLIVAAVAGSYLSRGRACADAHATIAAGVRFATASGLAAAAARLTLLSLSPLSHASPPLVALRELTSAGSLPECAPLLRCLRWSRSRQGAVCHRCSDSAGACCRPGASRRVRWRSVVFRRCDGSRCSRSWHCAVRRRWARTCSLQRDLSSSLAASFRRCSRSVSLLHLALVQCVADGHTLAFPLQMGAVRIHHGRPFLAVNRRHPPVAARRCMVALALMCSVCPLRRCAPPCSPASSPSVAVRRWHPKSSR
jgi:hypothetical protein